MPQMSIAMRLRQVVKKLIPPRIRPAAVVEQVLDYVREKGEVTSGLFAGMKCPTDFVLSANLPKLLGVYELELTPIFAKYAENRFTTVINVGGAEGYYANGLARIWPSARFIVYEAEEKGRQVIQEYAERNGVAERIDCRGFCDSESFRKILTETESGLVLMDIEGGEDELLSGSVLPLLKSFHILVELHDLRIEHLGQKLRERFDQTHTIEEIWTKKRTFGDFRYPPNPLLRLYLNEQLKVAADEKRGAPMRWFVMTPRVLSA
jgi:hypothetical protein